MRKKYLTIISRLVLLTLLIEIGAVMFPHKALAASCSFSFSGATVNVGDTFDLTLSWNTGDSDLGAFDGEVIYDLGMLELISGHQYPGEVLASPGQTSASYVYTFKALTAGTTSVSLSPGFVVSFTTEEQMSVSTSSGTVTIVEPTTAPPPTEPPTEPPTTQAPTEPPTQAPTEPPTTAAPTEPPTQAPTDPPATEPPTEPTTEPPTTEAPTTEEALSNNAYLEALSIYPGKMTPAFDRRTTIYEATVGNDVTKLSVSAVTEDEDATYIITDTNLKVGKNVIDIKVTAQDGKTVRWYAIRVTREGAETTAQATTEAPTTQEPTTAEPTTEEPTTSADPLEVVIGSVTGRVQESLKGVTAPEGYEETDYTYNGVEIEALKGLANGLILIPVSDGVTLDLYIYNEANGGLYPYVGIQITSALYTVLPFAEDEQIPSGYKRTVLEFNGSLVDAWIRDDAQNNNYVLFYAMNWAGTTALYRYDAEEKTLQRVNKEEIAVPTTEESTEAPVETPENTTAANQGNQSGSEVNSQYVAYYEEQLAKINRRDTIMFIIMVILLLCLIAMYLIFSSGRKEDPDSDPDNDPDDALEDDSDLEALDEDDLDSEEFDLEELLDSLDEETESVDSIDPDQVEELEKELEDIQLGMAGIVASFEQGENEEINEESENTDLEAAESENPKADDLELDDLELGDPELGDPEVDDPEVDDPELDDLEVEDLELEDLELEDLDLDELESE